MICEFLTSADAESFCQCRDAATEFVLVAQRDQSRRMCGIRKLGGRTEKRASAEFRAADILRNPLYLRRQSVKRIVALGLGTRATIDAADYRGGCRRLVFRNLRLELRYDAAPLSE